MTIAPAAIALFTDFGPADHYQGEMKAVLHAALPGLPVFDLMSGAPRCNPRAAAYLLAALLPRLPAPTLLIAVVDPGVGSTREVLLLECARHWLIGPDNGLLAITHLHLGGRVSVIDWRPPWLSSSFHGRDLMAPAALRLVRGEPLACHALSSSAMAGADWPADLPELIHVDGYGNLITGLRHARLPAGVEIELAGRRIGPASTFSAVGTGELFHYGNSSGLLEIAANQCSAARVLGCGVGAPVVIAREVSGVFNVASD